MASSRQPRGARARLPGYPADRLSDCRRSVPSFKCGTDTRKVRMAFTSVMFYDFAYCGFECPPCDGRLQVPSDTLVRVVRTSLGQSLPNRWSRCLDNDAFA